MQKFFYPSSRIVRGNSKKPRKKLKPTVEKQERLLPKSKEELKSYSLKLKQVNKEIVENSKDMTLWDRKRFLLAQLNYWNNLEYN